MLQTNVPGIFHEPVRRPVVAVRIIIHRPRHIRIRILRRPSVHNGRQLVSSILLHVLPQRPVEVIFLHVADALEKDRKVKRFVRSGGCKSVKISGYRFADARAVVCIYDAILFRLVTGASGLRRTVQIFEEKVARPLVRRNNIGVSVIPRRDL